MQIVVAEPIVPLVNPLSPLRTCVCTRSVKSCQFGSPPCEPSVAQARTWSASQSPWPPLTNSRTSSSDRSAPDATVRSSDTQGSSTKKRSISTDTPTGQAVVVVPEGVASWPWTTRPGPHRRRHHMRVRTRVRGSSPTSRPRSGSARTAQRGRAAGPPSPHRAHAAQPLGQLVHFTSDPKALEDAQAG